MEFPVRFSNLPAYAFPRLRSLLDAHPAGGDVIKMTIGEPTHAQPDWVADVIAEHVALFGNYPPNDGSVGLRAAISTWLARRYAVQVDPQTEILPLNGTREGLFNACIALCAEGDAVVLTPNPFYQVYAVAAMAVGATPHYVAATAETGFLPDYAALPAYILNRTKIAYICSPSNPQGAVADEAYWRDLIALAERYDFRIFADECYSEIYRDTPPMGALQVAHKMGADPDRVAIFHSLSKRSNMPGLRSGFVASGAKTITELKQLRNYAGAPLPGPLQAVAERAWGDETHVEASRARYVTKFNMVDEVFSNTPGCASPQAGFFLWLPVEDGEAATVKLWTETGVQVLPGAYLAREADGQNPGQNYIRVALVAEEQKMQRGLIQLRDCLY